MSPVVTLIEGEVTLVPVESATNVYLFHTGTTDEAHWPFEAVQMGEAMPPFVDSFRRWLTESA
jgi:hypothetical protein